MTLQSRFDERRDPASSSPSRLRLRSAKMPDSTPVAPPNDLSALWMPFSDNRGFKANPRLFSAAKDMHYVTPDGRRVLDATSGLWCVNAGHGRARIVAAIQAQAEVLDYAPGFNLGHPLQFELALRVRAI